MPEEEFRYTVKWDDGTGIGQSELRNVDYDDAMDQVLRLLRQGQPFVDLSFA